MRQDRGSAWPLSTNGGARQRVGFDDRCEAGKTSSQMIGGRDMPPLALWVSVLLAVGAGVSFVLQQAVNADLRAALGSAAWAGFVSYLGGTLCMFALALAVRDPLPATAMVARSNWWAWSGGFFGAIYIAISILLVPRIGAATFVALLVAGQMLSSLIADNYGWLGLAERPADVSRLVGAALLVAGVILIRR
jgi:bacterial/archaeal transporter family-2 protein